MFQDEARFGRMAKPRRCWAPKPCRPVMLNGYEREFVYAYGAVSPRDGDFDWKICAQMNTQRMSEFLEQVGQRHPGDFIVMVVDGASSHRGKDLIVPENIRLLTLPPYSPELNPMENVWDYLRQNKLCAQVWDTYDDILEACKIAWNFLIDDPDRIQSLGTRDWACVNV